MLTGLLYIIGGVLSVIIITVIIWHQIFPPKSDHRE